MSFSRFLCDDHVGVDEERERANRPSLRFPEERRARTVSAETERHTRSLDSVGDINRERRSLLDIFTGAESIESKQIRKIWDQAAQR